MNTTKHQSSPVTRRRFLQIVAVTGMTGAAFWRWGAADFPGLQTVRRSKSLMGTVLNLIVIGPDRDAAEEAVTATFNHMARLEGRLSRHRPDSELSLLNRQGRLDNAGKDLRTVLMLAQSISRESGGAFDITVLPLLLLHQQCREQGILPAAAEIAAARQLVDHRLVQVSDRQVSLARSGMGITLDGIGKGYIVDQGVATLKKHDFPNVFVEAGGDLMAAGSKAQGRPWRIGIKNPRPQMSGAMVAIEAVNRAVATSGDYMQAYAADFSQHHIINPATGFSPPELASCTVAAPSAALADGLATAAMVLGAEKSLALLESLPGCEGYLIAKDLTHYQTSGFFG